MGIRRTPGSQPKASLEQDPNLLMFGSGADAVYGLRVFLCCGSTRCDRWNVWKGVEGCCRGSSPTAKGRLMKPTDIRRGQFTLSMKAINQLRLNNLTGIATPWSAPGLGRGPERETFRFGGSYAFATGGCGRSQPLLPNSGS